MEVRHNLHMSHRGLGSNIQAGPISQDRQTNSALSFINIDFLPRTRPILCLFHNYRSVFWQYFSKTWKHNPCELSSFWKISKNNITFQIPKISTRSQNDKNGCRVFKISYSKLNIKQLLNKLKTLKVAKWRKDE